MEQWRGRVALVTGASAGIGADVCRRLVQHGLRVVGCARSVDKIQKLSNELGEFPGSLTAIRCDLTQTEQIEAMFRTIKQELGGVDICINNAGLSFESSLLEGTLSQWRNMVDVNVLATALCAQLSVANMRERGVARGQIININSTLGHEVLELPPVHFYAGTKFAMTALTEGLRQELAAIESASLKVAQISPGPVCTSFFKHMFSDENMIRHFESIGINASDITDAVIYILSTPARVQVRDIIVEPLRTPLVVDGATSKTA